MNINVSLFRLFKVSHKNYSQTFLQKKRGSHVTSNLDLVTHDLNKFEPVFHKGVVKVLKSNIIK